MRMMRGSVVSGARALGENAICTCSERKGCAVLVSNWLSQATRSVRVGFAGLAVLSVAAWAAGPGTGAAAASSVAFNTPGTYSFVVPANVSSLTITAIGGAGGGCYEGTGGEGAAVSEAVPVTPGAQLTIGVAGNAAACDATSGAGAGGVGGGGASGTATEVGPSGGGGGASLVTAPAKY